MLAGVSRGGKTVVAGVLGEMVGRENCAAMDFAQLGSPHGLESLVGRTAAVVGDGHVGRDSDTVRILERLKSIVGGDPQVVNPKHRAAYDALLRCRFTVCVNALPRLPDSSAALRARMLVLPFRVSFEGREDRGLADKLREELPGITNWALAGLRRLREKGRLETPESGRHLLEQFVRQNSPVLGFVTDWCVLGDDAEATTSDVQDAWWLWCEENGHHGGSVEYLGTQLLAIGPRIRKVRRTEAAGGGKPARRMHYEGIGLNEDAADALKAHRLRYKVRR
jgi:putative DNA primase/helicase